MRTIGLQTIYKFQITPTCFGAEAHPQEVSDTKEY